VEQRKRVARPLNAERSKEEEVPSQKEIERDCSQETKRKDSEEEIRGGIVGKCRAVKIEHDGQACHNQFACNVRICIAHGIGPRDVRNLGWSPTQNALADTHAESERAKPNSLGNRHISLSRGWKPKVTHEIYVLNDRLFTALYDNGGSFLDKV
jgi:hypothetical protein